MTHLCPFTLGDLMALYACAQVNGSHALAAKVLNHSREHEPERREDAN